MSKEAMKLALEALEQLDGIDTETECVTFDVGEAITALREALAQQEPVAQKIWEEGDYGPFIKELKDIPVGAFLYTSPPSQRTWVNLTEREVELIDGMIEVQLHHAAQCDRIINRTMAEKQKGWDMERAELLRRLKEKNT